MKCLRQGDVLLIPCESVKGRGGTPLSPGDVCGGGHEGNRPGPVLAVGEDGGHAHVVVGGEVIAIGNDYFVEASPDNVAELRHLDRNNKTAEHKPITLDRPYRYEHQEEYEPDGWRELGD